MSITDTASVTLLLAGTTLALIGAIGTHRFNNVFSRMHAATKPVTLGILLIGIGAGLRASDTGDLVKIGLAVFLQLLTAPLGMHLLGRAAYHTGGHLDPATTLDELAPTSKPGVHEQQL